MHKVYISIVILFTFISTIFAIDVGTNSPDFTVIDGDGKELRSSSLKGSVVVGFYESRNSSGKNDELKNELNNFKKLNSDKMDIIRLAVIDGSPANFSTRWIWEKKLRQKSVEKGIPIFGDWDGSMRNAFGFIRDESNFFIMDKRGIIRFIRSGKVSASEYMAIKDFIAKFTVEVQKK